MKSKFLTIILFYLSVSLPLGAQDSLALIPFKYSNFKIQTYPLGDSLLLSIMENSVNRSTHEFWIDGSGNISTSLIKASNKLHDFAVQLSKFNNDYYTYYLSQQSQSFLDVVVNDNFENATRLQIPGTILKAITRENLFILSFDKKKKTLNVVEVEKDEIKKMSTFSISFDFSKYKDSHLQYIPQQSYLTLSESSSRMKVYLDKDILIISVDEHAEHWSAAIEGVIPKTLIYTFNLSTSEIRVISVFESSQNDFRSFLFDGILYRIINQHDKFELKIFDPEVSTRNNILIPKVPESKDMNVFLKSGADNTIGHDENLWRMISSSTSCKPFLFVEKDGDDKPIITWGTFYNKKSVVTGGAPAGLASFIITSTVGTAIRQMSEASGIYRYFYMTKDSVGGFKFATENPRIARTAIDSYEIEQNNKKVKYKLKAYSTWGSDVIGIYQKNRGKGLELVRFNNLYP